MRKTNIARNLKMNPVARFAAIIRRYGTLSAASVILIVFGTTLALAQAILGEFGVGEADLKSRAVDALISGYPIYPNRAKFKAASQSVRAEFARSVFSVLKAYTETESFKTSYAKRRAEWKPSAPAIVSPDEQYAKYIADIKKSLDDTKASLEKMPPDVRKGMEPVVKSMEESYAKQVNDTKMIAMLKESYARQAEYAQQSYNDDLRKWEERYPVDPNVLIAKRLRELLELTNAIPYDAKLVTGDGGVMTFADPQLERKSSDWKICYRMGREPVEAARALATEWLKQLEK